MAALYWEDESVGQLLAQLQAQTCSLLPFAAQFIPVNCTQMMKSKQQICSAVAIRLKQDCLYRKPARCFVHPTWKSLI